MADIMDRQIDRPPSRVTLDTLPPNDAAAYRAAHRNRLMVLTKLRSETPAQDEFCRVCGVETLAPGLWITASFRDGSTKTFRPEKIRLATASENLLSDEWPGLSQPRAQP